jgi:hypothetical protein
MTAEQIDKAVAQLNNVPSDDLLSQLTEAPKDSGQNAYSLADGFRFAIKLVNTYRVQQQIGQDPPRPDTLQVTLLNCTAGGKVEYLGAVSVETGDSELLWRHGELGIPFIAHPRTGYTTGLDRLIAIATTGRGHANLEDLRVHNSVQEVIDAVIAGASSRTRDAVDVTTPAELWTAVQVPVRIGTPGTEGKS